MNDVPEPMQQPQQDPSAPIAKPRVWTVFLALIVAMIIGVGATAIYVAIAGFVLSDDPHNAQRMTNAVMSNPNAIIPTFAIMGFALLLVTTLATALSPENFRNRLSLHPSSLRNQDYTAVIFLTYGVSMVASQLTAFIPRADSPTLKLIQNNIRAANPFMFALAAFFIAGTAPIAEELFFRGYLQTRLRERWGRTIAIALSAIAFGVFHMDPIQSLFAAAMGVALGYVAERSGSIRPAIAGHVFNNLVAVLIARAVEAPADSNEKGSLVVLALGVVIASCGFTWLHRLPKSQ